MAHVFSRRPRVVAHHAVEGSGRDLLLEADQLVSVVTSRFAAVCDADLREVLVRQEDGDSSIVAFADDADLKSAHTGETSESDGGPESDQLAPHHRVRHRTALRPACAIRRARGPT